MDITGAVFRSGSSEFTIEPLVLASPGPGEVLVKIVAVGLCHTDIATQAGVIPFPSPGVLGHEGSGRVVEVGPGVTKVAPGDPVALSFSTCGKCPSCVAGEPAYCHMFMPLNYAGSRLDGTSPLTTPSGEQVGSMFFGQSSFATHAVAPERNVVKVPEDAPLDIVGPLGCGVQTGAGAVMRSFAAPPGSSIVVLGAGSVGLSAVLGAVVQNLAHILVVEPHETRRALALELGATHAIDPTAGNLTEQIRAVVPDGVDYVFDTTGRPDVIEASIAGLTNRGTLGLVGVPSDPAAAVSLNIIGLMLQGLTVKGIVEGDSDPDVFIPELLALYAEGRFPFDKMVTKVPFGQINEAVDLQHKGEAVKVVLVHE
ncbi:MAG: aryl-alcohol dehydrogenase [Actinomycetota bacterium]|nr:aryl-alcohol dehydrogenase [Actinomycetota bacterium]